MADLNPARVVAPLALLAGVVGVVVVVQASRPSSPDAPTATHRTSTQQQPRSSRPRRARIYVVKAGDTLTVIADKADLTLEDLQRLNPDVDPQALQTGQRIKLSP